MLYLPTMIVYNESSIVITPLIAIIKYHVHTRITVNCIPFAQALGSPLTRTVYKGRLSTCNTLIFIAPNSTMALKFVYPNTSVKAQVDVNDEV